MKTYRTTNIYLAAALISLGAPLSDMDRQDKRHQVFILSGELDFDEKETEWYENRLCGNLCKNRDALQQLKSKIHSL
jgi:hypothetical protein